MSSMNRASPCKGLTTKQAGRKALGRHLHSRASRGSPLDSSEPSRRDSTQSFSTRRQSRRGKQGVESRAFNYKCYKFSVGKSERSAGFVANSRLGVRIDEAAEVQYKIRRILKVNHYP